MFNELFRFDRPPEIVRPAPLMQADLSSVPLDELEFHHGCFVVAIAPSVAQLENLLKTQDDSDVLLSLHLVLLVF